MRLNPHHDDFLADIETNGLRRRGQKIHCLELVHLQSGTPIHCADQPGYTPLADGLQMLALADHVIGHNILQFDAPCLERVLGLKIPAAKIVDTLLASRVLRADVQDSDTEAAILPPALRGKHSLESWGYRLQMDGLLKDNFAHRQDQPWSKALQAHCANDVLLQWALLIELLDVAA